MILDREAAKNTAEFLLQIKAIKRQPSDPFTWASGWKSPIYCDNRLSLSYPPIRTYLSYEMAKAILTQYGTPNVIAGVATGAIAIGALVAEKLNLPFVYIRSKSKAHGRQNQIEGHLERGQNVVIIEDLISTGMSSLAAYGALKEAEANIMGMAAIFTYGFDVAKQNFEDAGCDLVTLSDYHHLLERAEELDYVRENELETLKEWRTAPDQWGQ